MLVTGKNILDEANKGGYAVGAFNTSNMEITQAIARAAVLERSPAIIQTTEGAIGYAGVEYLAGIVKTAARLCNVPIALHLDHGKSIKMVVECIKNGYSSVMIDGSHLRFDRNIRITKEVARYAHARGVSVEGELGVLGGAEDKVKGKILMTNPDAALEFVKKTNVDALAVAIGTSHGAYKFRGRGKLDFERLKEIKEKVKIPIVLHGASGIAAEIVRMAERYGAKLGEVHGVSDSQIRMAIRLGVSKINIDSDLRISFDAGIRKVIKEKPEVFDPREMLGAARDMMTDVVRKKMRLFGSRGRG